MRCNQRQKVFRTDQMNSMLMQLRKFKDITKDGEVRTDDMKKIKVKRADAVKVHDILMSIRQFELNTYNYYKKIKQISIKFLKQY